MNVGELYMNGIWSVNSHIYMGVFVCVYVCGEDQGVDGYTWVYGGILSVCVCVYVGALYMNVYML